MEDEEEAMVIAMEKSRKIVKVFIVSFCLVRNVDWFISILLFWQL